MERYKPGLARNQSLVQQLTEFQKNPKSLIFVSLADTYRQEGLPLQALEILEEGLGVHPHLPSALLCQSRCLFDTKRYAEALKITQVLLKANPDNLRANKLQAEIYVRLGQRRSAIRALTRVVSLFPQDKESVRALEELENLEYGTNIPTNQILRASVDSPPVLGKIEEFEVGTLSDSFAAIGAISAAPSNKALRSPLETAEVEDDEPTFATRTIAELYIRQGLAAKARRVIQKILREDPTNEWARETLQDLESDGIVARSKGNMASDKLKKKARVLEKILAQVRLMKPMGA